MTDSEYNCFSCKNSECKFHETQKPISYLDTPISSIIQIFTSDKGCASHSSNPAPSPQPMPEFTPYVPGDKETNTYRCCEVCPNVPCKPLFRVNCIRQDPAAIRNATLEPLKATYNKFECLDKILSDVAGKCGEAKTATMLEVAGEMWGAIKESLRTQPQEPKP